MAQKKHLTPRDFPLTFRLKTSVSPYAILLALFVLAFAWVLTTVPDRPYPVYVAVLIGISVPLLFAALLVLRNLVAEYTGWYLNIRRPYYFDKDLDRALTQYKLRDALSAGWLLMLLTFFTLAYFLNR